MNQLSSEHISFFKDKGYLILKGILEKNLCAKAQDRMWSALPSGSPLVRDDPQTYQGPFPEAETSRDPLHIRDGYLWQLRECGTEQLLIDLIYNDGLCAIVEQLLGKDIRD